MDDLYQNAWSETSDTAPAFSNNSTPSWPTSHKHTKSYGEEADLAAPSWSTGAGISWDEPTGNSGLSWSHTDADADAGWGPSTYEGISFGTSSVEIEEKTDVVAAPAPNERDDDAVRTSSPGSSSLSPPSSPSYLPASSSPPPSADTIQIQSYEVAVEGVAPPSPDGFGGFESGLAEESTPSPGFQLNDAESDPWGPSAWADTKAEREEDEEEVIDEWERAKQEKAKQDRHVVRAMFRQSFQGVLIDLVAATRTVEQYIAAV